jgi:hypothetical protein
MESEKEKKNPHLTLAAKAVFTHELELLVETLLLVGATGGLVGLAVSFGCRRNTGHAAHGDGRGRREERKGGWWRRVKGKRQRGAMPLSHSLSPLPLPLYTLKLALKCTCVGVFGMCGRYYHPQHSAVARVCETRQAAGGEKNACSMMS